MKLLKSNKNVGSVQTFIMSIIGVAVVLMVGLVIMSELGDSTLDGGSAINGTSFCSGSGGSWNGTACSPGALNHELPSAFTATDTLSAKLGTVPTWIGILITVAMAFIVLGYFYSRRA